MVRQNQVKVYFGQLILWIIPPLNGNTHEGSWNLEEIPIISLLLLGKAVRQKGKWLTGHFYLASSKWKLIPTSRVGRSPSPLPVSGMRQYHIGLQQLLSLHTLGINENFKTLWSRPWNWGLYHNPAFTRWVPNFTLRAPPLQPNWVDAIKVRLVWKGGRNSQQFLPSPVNLQTAHLPLSSLAQHVHTC